MLLMGLKIKERKITDLFKIFERFYVVENTLILRQVSVSIAKFQQAWPVS